MSWADNAKALIEADPIAKRAFVARAIGIETTGLEDGAIEDARRKIAEGYRMGTIALDLEDAQHQYRAHS